MGLMGKSKTFALHVVGNPLWQKVGQHFLSSKLSDYWVGLVAARFVVLLEASEQRRNVGTLRRVKREMEPSGKVESSLTY